MRVDWEGVIQGYFTLAEALPRLTTVAAVVEQNPISLPAPPAPPAATLATSAPAAPAPPTGRLGLSMIAAVAAGVVLVALASLALRRGSRDSSCP